MIAESTTTETVDSSLTNVLKAYYQLCRQCTDKSTLVLDATFLQTLTTYVGDRHPKVSLYVCKILLSMSESAECASKLSSHDDLVKSVTAACNDSEIPLRINKSLMIVLSRLNNAKRSANIPKNVPTQEPTKPASFYSKASKQFIFSFDHPTEIQKRQMELNCLQVRGVVSVCFQFNSTVYAMCVVRCREDVEAKTVASQLLRTGLDVVQLQVRLEDGRRDTFDFYANDESLAPAADGSLKSRREMNLPAYLDDKLADIDPNQCIISKEQLEKEKKASGVWFSLPSFKFW